MEYIKYFEDLDQVLQKSKDTRALIDSVIDDFKRIIKSGVDVNFCKDVSQNLLDEFIGDTIGYSDALLIEGPQRISRYFLSGYHGEEGLKQVESFYDRLSLSGSKLIHEFTMAIDFKASPEKKSTYEREIKDIKSKCDGHGVNLKVSDSPTYLDLVFSVEISKSLVNLTRDYHKYLPKNIIDKFDEFLINRSLSWDDRSKLVDIIKDGDWSSI